MWLLDPALRRSAYDIGRTRVSRSPSDRGRQKKTISVGCPVGLLAGDDLILLYDLGPSSDLAFDKVTELFRRRQLIFDPLIMQTPLNRRLAQSLSHSGIHPHDNVARSFRRREQAPPSLRIESDDAQLSNRRCIRQLGITFSGGHRDRSKRPRLNMG